MIAHARNDTCLVSFLIRIGTSIGGAICVPVLFVFHGVGGCGLGA